MPFADRPGRMLSVDSCWRLLSSLGNLVAPASSRSTGQIQGTAPVPSRHPGRRGSTTVHTGFSNGRVRRGWSGPDVPEFEFRLGGPADLRWRVSNKRRGGNPLDQQAPPRMNAGKAGQQNPRSRSTPGSATGPSGVSVQRHLALQIMHRLPPCKASGVWRPCAPP